MPELIDRIEAERAVLALRNGPRARGRCLMCALLEGGLGAPRLIADGVHATVLLTSYPVRWGHLMVVLRQHSTSFSDVATAAWLEACALAKRAAAVVEAELRPARCYVASLGAALTDVPMSSPHLHLHVLPVYGAGERPSEVFTWRNGVYQGSADEWQSLAGRLARAWVAL